MGIAEPTPTETKLVERLKLGEQAAFAELYDNYGRALHGIIFHITNSAAETENLLQDTFVKIWRNIARYDPSKGRLYTWLVVVARRTALDFMRSAYFSQKQAIQSDDALVTVGAHAPEIKQVEFLGLDTTLAALEPKLKQVIDMQYFLGYSQQEVADELGLPLGTVKSRTRAALIHLRKQLHTEEL